MNNDEKDQRIRKIKVNYLKSTVRLNSFNNGLFDFSFYSRMSASRDVIPKLQWYRICNISSMRPSVSSGDETLCHMLDILFKQNDFKRRN